MQMKQKLDILFPVLNDLGFVRHEVFKIYDLFCQYKYWQNRLNFLEGFNEKERDQKAIKYTIGTIDSLEWVLKRILGDELFNDFDTIING